MPAVTVIVNLYNGRATVAETIESVLAQTIRDWELLVWDDASSDGGGVVVTSYADPRIRYFRSDAQVPLGRARQAAIDLARGEWVAFLDHDDVWLPQKLERQLDLAEARPEVALVYGRTVRFYPNGRERDYDQAHEYTALPEGDIFRSLFNDSCYIAMSSAMFRRSAIAAVGGIPESIRIIPDYYLYLAVTRQFPAAAVQQVVCRYRMHDTNTSHAAARAVHEEALRLMEMFRSEVDAELLAKCKRHHSTQLALAEMQSGIWWAGAHRLLRDGSLLSQLLRPAWSVVHSVRRSLVPPRWKTTTS